jgi:hypothetical protein
MAGERGRVVAFEPFPMNIEIAKLNTALNNCFNIDLIDAALSNRAGHTNASTIEECIEIGNQDAQDLIELKLVRLDEFAHLRPDFLRSISRYARAYLFRLSRKGASCSRAGETSRFGATPASARSRLQLRRRSGKRA